MKLHELKIAQKHAKIGGRVLMIGYGSVGQALLPLLLRHIEVDPKKITVLEMDKKAKVFKDKFGGLGIKYVNLQIVKSNLEETLAKYVSIGDLLIDVSLNIDGVAIAKYCLEHGILYINTSIERWEDEPDETIPVMAERTLYHSHQMMREATAEFKDKGATCVVTHGANPGLVTYFTKMAVLDIAKAMKLNFEGSPETREDWAQLMQATGTQVIHVAERDTQVINVPKAVGEFVNTWSCEGFWAEGRAPAELGWGTHEAEVPYNGFVHTEGPQNAAYLGQPGAAVLVKSWVPLGGAYNGFLVQHSEAITISEYFTVYEGKDAVYRPTVNYAYLPCDAAVVSVHEYRGRELEMQDKKRVAKNEITSGIDELGVLLLGHGKNAWWYGSQLGIDEARRLLPGENATSVQVVASLLGALVWMLKNPNEGYCEPEDLPYKEILEIARPYLGPIASVQSDWTPLEDRNVLFRRALDPEHPWRFENFRVWS